MFHGNKVNYLAYKNFQSIVNECLDIVTKVEKENFEEGKFEIGSGCFAISSEYWTQPISGLVTFEGHKKFVDLQYVVFGLETILYTPISAIKKKLDYNEKEDVWKTTLCASKVQSIKLMAGDFLLLYPEDAHGPQYCSGNSISLVKKIVVKIPCQLLQM
jgi:YhcH/YjgK/YiaL family protein